MTERGTDAESTDILVIDPSGLRRCHPVLEIRPTTTPPVEPEIKVAPIHRPSDWKVDVVIPCHNYGQYLDECLRSVLLQSRPPDSVLVVDDASDQDIASIVRRYEPWGVEYLRIEARNVVEARRAGFEYTKGEVVCFVDADDVLTPDYLRNGMDAFSHQYVGIVYSDIETFGDTSEQRLFPDFSRNTLDHANFIHAASLYLRAAIEQANAFGGLLHTSHEDWVFPQRITRIGWQAVKQASKYRYRIHSQSRCQRQFVDAKKSYYDSAGLSAAEITIFTPLAGRVEAWGPYWEWLQSQEWPTEQCRVWLYDTSGDPAFLEMVRRSIQTSRYPDIRLSTKRVGDHNLADLPREQHAHAVRLAMARIYNDMARQIETPFCLVVEDDVIPPVDIVDRLLRSLSWHTVSVGAPYLSRFHRGYVLQPTDVDLVRDGFAGWQTVGDGAGSGVVGYHGFGCALLRRSALDGHVFSHTGPLPDADLQWCHTMRENGLEVAADWDARAIHLGAEHANPNERSGAELRPVRESLGRVVAPLGSSLAGRRLAGLFRRRD